MALHFWPDDLKCYICWNTRATLLHVWFHSWLSVNASMSWLSLSILYMRLCAVWVFPDLLIYESFVGFLWWLYMWTNTYVFVSHSVVHNKAHIVYIIHRYIQYMYELFGIYDIKYSSCDGTCRKCVYSAQALVSTFWEMIFTLNDIAWSVKVWGQRAERSWMLLVEEEALKRLSKQVHNVFCMVSLMTPSKWQRRQHWTHKIIPNPKDAVEVVIGLKCWCGLKFQKWWSLLLDQVAT